ncbi:MAG: Fe-S-binding domain-containing protein [Phototrophicales bacterium]|nr:MAG: Fe-S-binding domain-containing protein [Phototrophicales bacterium]
MTLTTLVLFAPLVGFLYIIFAGRMPEDRVKWVALITSLATFGLSVLMLVAFDSKDPGLQMEQKFDWIPGVNITFHIAVDGISIWLVMLTTFIVPIAILASFSMVHERLRLYYAFMLLLETAMIGVFVAQDMFLFYIFWEVTLVPMYFMVGIWGGEERIYAAIKFFLYTMAGSILMLIAILWLGGEAGTFNVAEITNMVRNGELTFSTNTERLLFAGFFIAFAIKVPVFPFHSWLPDAHVQAPTAGSVLLAGVMLKLGTYGFIRFNLPFFPNASADFAPWIAVLAVIGIIYGAIVAYAQTDIKKLVAYSSISHLGFVVLGIFAMNSTGVQGAILQMVNHGISTGGLFLVVGMLYERRHTKAIDAYGGVWKAMPLLTGLMLVISLSSMGLPGLNGFVGEFTILLGSARSEVLSLWFTAFAATGVILAAVYILFMFNKVFMGPLNKPEVEALEDLTWQKNWNELGALIPIVVMAIVIGVYSAPFFEYMDASVSQITQLIDATVVASR